MAWSQRGQEPYFYFYRKKDESVMVKGRLLQERNSCVMLLTRNEEN